MQLIWVSGPTARVVTISITARTIAAAVGALCTLMLALGVLFHFIGLRIAVEFSPEVAQAIGGVASVAEHERMEARYRAELQRLQEQAGQALGRVAELERSRGELLALLGVRQSGIPRQPMPDASPKGGPLRLLDMLDLRLSPLDVQWRATSRHFALIDASLTDLQQRWTHDGRRLEHLPAALPMAEGFYMSSGFGIRPDPLTGQNSLHEGVDFVARVGTPVHATGRGTVRRSEYAGDLGQMVEVEHAEGYVSRYAHLSRRLVQPGQSVARGQVVGELGNSGRSTGAHLHYEIEHQGRLIDPNRALAPLAFR